MLWIGDPSSDVQIPAMSGMSDGLDPLVGRSLHELNLIALESTAKAHDDGGCPSMMMTLQKMDAQHLGYFLYTMMYACALSGIMIGVNPFDQP
jgi:glucose-6-phosphate isomerase